MLPRVVVNAGVSTDLKISMSGIFRTLLMSPVWVRLNLRGPNLSILIPRNSPILPSSEFEIGASVHQY